MWFGRPGEARRARRRRPGFGGAGDTRGYRLGGSLARPYPDRSHRERAVGPVGDCCTTISSSVRFIPVSEDHGVSREAYLPAQRPPPSQEARFPRSHEHPRRPCRVEVTPRQGPGPSVGLIGRIQTRSDFQRLRRDGRRVRIEPFWCSHLPDPSSNTAQVAFAINRAVGNAVTRNRLRRRSRAVLTDLDLPGGLYLIGCTPKANELTFDQIRAVLGELPMKIARP